MHGRRQSKRNGCGAEGHKRLTHTYLQGRPNGNGLGFVDGIRRLTGNPAVNQVPHQH
jgi:hypothetical protein